MEVGQKVRLQATGNSYFEAKGVLGKVATVTKVITEPDETHDLEPLPMWRILFDDPADVNEVWYMADIEVWPDEVEVLNGTN